MSNYAGEQWRHTVRKLIIPGPTRVGAIEAKIGMSLLEYFRGAIDRGLSQREMAVELGTTPASISNWMRKLGFRPVMTYIETGSEQ